MKSETSFRVFFLKQHRKNGLKNIFSHQKVYFWISAFDHRAIVLDKMHIVHWREGTGVEKIIRLCETDRGTQTMAVSVRGQYCEWACTG